MLVADAGMYAALVLMPVASIPIVLLYNALEYPLLAGGLALAAGAVADALTSNRGMNISTRQVASARQIIYGQQRVGGVVIYQSTTGAGGSGGNYVYNYVICVATHVMDAFINLYLDGRQVFWKQDGNTANVGCGSVATPATTSVTIAGGAVTAISVSAAGSGYANVKPTRYRVRIYGGGGTGAAAYATNSGTALSPVFAVTVTAGGSGYTTAPTAEIQGAYIFGGVAAADTQDPTQIGYGSGYGIGPSGAHYNFSGKVFCEARFGDQIPTDYMASLVANDSTWPVTANVSGVAYLYLNVGYDTNLFTNPPEIRITVNGKNNILDPRMLGPGTITTVAGSGAVVGTGTSFLTTFSVGALISVPYAGDEKHIVTAIADNTHMTTDPWANSRGGSSYDFSGSGSIGFSANWALQVADVISDPVFGLGDGASINMNQLIAAANVCDELVLTSQGNEPRYTQHLHYDTSTAPGDVLALMMPSAGGRLSRIGGQWFIFPAYWQAPSYSFDSSTLIDAPTWTPNRSFKDLFNRVNGTYTAPNYPYATSGNLYDANGWYYGTRDNVWPFAWQPTNFPQYACDVRHGYSADLYLAEDGGIQLPKELGLRGVISIVQAQRLAKIALMQNRFQGSGSFPMTLAAWQMQPGDVMNFTWPALGWSAKILEVASVQFNCEPVKPADGEENSTPALWVTVGAIETDPSIYEWSETEELTPYDVPAAPSQIPGVAAPPTVFTVTSSAATALVGADGTVTPRALLSWDAPLDISVTGIEMEYQATGATVWLNAGTVGVGLFEAFVGGVIAGGTYNFQIRSARPTGGTSAWVEVTGVVISITLGTTVTNGGPVTGSAALSAAAFSDGTAAITVSPFTATAGSLVVSCLGAGAYTITGLAQQQLYEVYYIDPTFAGGAITPIATQNPTDYLGKVGYFLIGSIVTPSYSTRYQPNSFSDLGSSTTQTPPAAYDNNLTTSAAVLGRWWTVETTDPITHLPSFSYLNASGDCIWFGFPSVVTTAALTLHVTAAAGASGTGPFAGSIAATVAGTTTTLQSFTGSAAQTDYTLAIPSGTNLSTVSIEVKASTTTGSSPGGGTIAISEVEIYIQ
jgi:hypothetical protein